MRFQRGMFKEAHRAGRGGLPWGLLALVVALVQGGCTRPNPHYCDEATQCPEGLTCLMDLNLCVPADGGTGDGPVLCHVSPECSDPERPICEANQCRQCGSDAECEDRSSSTPVCVGGRCMECRVSADCGPDLPVCGSDGRCKACERDVECLVAGGDPAPVCLSGRCLPSEDVLWVDVAANCSMANGSRGAPFCQIKDAITAALSDPRRAIVAHHGAYQRFEVRDVRLTGLMIVGYPGAGEVRVEGPSNLPVVLVQMEGTITLRRLRLKGASSQDVFSCSDAACTLEEMEIDSGEIGVRATNAQPLVVRRSRIHHNTASGIYVDAYSSYRIENNFIFVNGSPTSLLAAVHFESSFGITEFVNNTVYLNTVAPNNTAGVRCDSNKVIVRNNILWGNRSGTSVKEVNREGQVPVCDVTYSVIDEADLAAAGHNVGMQPTFVSDVAPYDLHLTEGSSGIDAGDGTVAPTGDIDGDARPYGAAVDVGADEWVP